jgi:hypothetical protein
MFSDGGTPCGSHFGKGWWPVIREALEAIALLDPDCKVDQIKEKFGGLRFYYAGGTGNDARIDELIAQAERVAAQTCELCGAPGRARGTGWIRTVCDEHAEGRLDL